MSTLEVSNLNDGTTTVATTFVTNGSAKVWVHFHGNGTVAIQDSLNTSSITDNGQGYYSVNFSSNFNTNNYAASSLSNHLGGVTSQTWMSTTSWLASSLGLLAERFDNTSRWDPTETTATFHGDLA